MLQPDYHQLVALARRASRNHGEAEDLLQDALIEALRLGRDDFSNAENRRWLYGIVRNKARQAARGAARGRRRDTEWSATEVGPTRPDPSGSDTPAPAELLAGLPPALRAVAVLALTGHNRREIAWLLRLEDAALRQRITQLRKRFAAAGIAAPSGLPGLNLDLAYGRLRDALLPALLRSKGLFASHDPDGHLFVFARSQNHEPRQV